MIAKYIDDEVLDRIAEADRKGRRPYVPATGLDHEEPVVWDMGAVAAGTGPVHLDLFPRVIPASASIPVLFPRVLINVKIDGAERDARHVGRGVFARSFFVGKHDLGLSMGEKGIPWQRIPPGYPK
jgi:hypothetical protein